MIDRTLIDWLILISCSCCRDIHFHSFCFFFFFNDTATTEIYTLSLHDALPISTGAERGSHPSLKLRVLLVMNLTESADRKSSRLNSSHMSISYAVFCLKKKNKKQIKYTIIYQNINYCNPHFEGYYTVITYDTYP